MIGASGAAWTGRWRTWARHLRWATAPLHLLPAAGLLLLLGAVDELTGGVPAALGLLIIPAFALGALGILGFVWRAPEWSTPGWYRTVDRSLDIRGDELTALLYLAAAAGSGHASQEEANAAFAGQEPELRW